MVGRLTAKMVKVLQADQTNTRGQRNVIDGEAELLTGFEFNINGKVGNTIYAPFSSSIDRVAGTLEVSIPSFKPAQMIAAPSGATHFKFVTGGAEVDFENESFVIDLQESAILPWTNPSAAAITLTNTVTANSTSPLFLAFGIEFYQEVNAEMYPLKNGSHNTLSLVAVSGM
jgi:hypothetical protein